MFLLTEHVYRKCVHNGFLLLAGDILSCVGLFKLIMMA